MKIIEAKNLSYAYPGADRNAVDDVSFSIGEGQFVCVVGHNGSGKSTLAKMLNCLIRPASGTIRVAGITPETDEDEWNVRRQCGMVFQNPDNQIVATIVEEDVAFGLENLGIEPKEIRLRVDEALRVVGMEAFAAAQPHMLSGGQKQRVAIAGVYAMRPRVIVFDEATAMLDPSGRQSIMDIALSLNKNEGVTVVWITHFMEEAARADRVVAMDGGRIRLEGSPRDLFMEAEKIRSMGLDVPQMTRLAMMLRERGVDMPDGILSVEEMVVALCRLK